MTISLLLKWLLAKQQAIWTTNVLTLKYSGVASWAIAVSILSWKKNSTSVTVFPLYWQAWFSDSATRTQDFQLENVFFPVDYLIWASVLMICGWDETQSFTWAYKQKHSHTLSTACESYTRWLQWHKLEGGGGLLASKQQHINETQNNGNRREWAG